MERRAEFLNDRIDLNRGALERLAPRGDELSEARPLVPVHWPPTCRQPGTVMTAEPQPKVAPDCESCQKPPVAANTGGRSSAWTSVSCWVGLVIAT